MTTKDNPNLVWESGLSTIPVRTPAIGDIVHYIDVWRTILPAIVVSTEPHFDEVNLTIFKKLGDTAWANDVPHDENKKPNTWHWPERSA